MRDRLKSRFRTLVSGIALRAIRAGVVSRRAVIVFGVIAGLLAVPAAAGAVLPGPNGRIVFTSGRDDGFSTFDDAHAQLWVADKAGATPRRVTVNAAIQHRHASWSPDRTKLVYSAGNAATGDFDIYILDLTQPASGDQSEEHHPVSRYRRRPSVVVARRYARRLPEQGPGQHGPRPDRCSERHRPAGKCADPAGRHRGRGQARLVARLEDALLQPRRESGRLAGRRRHLHEGCGRQRARRSRSSPGPPTTTSPRSRLTDRASASREERSARPARPCSGPPSPVRT